VAQMAVGNPRKFSPHNYQHGWRMANLKDTSWGQVQRLANGTLAKSQVMNLEVGRNQPQPCKPSVLFYEK
jgi:hypothetical protein